MVLKSLITSPHFCKDCSFPHQQVDKSRLNTKDAPKDGLNPLHKIVQTWVTAITN